MAGDVRQIPESRDSWTERPSDAEMADVRELLGLIDRNRLTGAMVAAIFMW